MKSEPILKKLKISRKHIEYQVGQKGIYRVARMGHHRTYSRLQTNEHVFVLFISKLLLVSSIYFSYFSIYSFWYLLSALLINNDCSHQIFQLSCDWILS